MIKRIDEIMDAEVDFGFETTLTTLSYLNTIKAAKEKGYFVTLLFFWLNDVNLAIERVKNRVSEGGHNIPEDIIKRRYYRGIKNIDKFIPLCDYWIIVDNSVSPFTFVAEGEEGNENKIHNDIIWNKINEI